MKSVEQALVDVGRRLHRDWADVVTIEASDSDSCVSGDPVAWPHAFPLGLPSSAVLATDFSKAVTWAAHWRDWAAGAGAGVELRFETRRVSGTEQRLPTHLLVDDVGVAARLAGPDRVAWLARGRARADLLHRRFPHLAADGTLAATVRAVVDYAEIDIELLIRAGLWFTAEHAAGLTPRQVPIEGMHAKWLNTRKHLVLRLAGRDDLGLAPPHPARVHFSYLDPVHRAAGGRRHDSVTVGDPMRPAYLPSIVLISENKDTAINFPDVAHAVSVEGAGNGGGTIAAITWLAQAERVVYWGDMDAAGLEILNGFRAAGVPATSMFMDLETFERWERFGTDVDAKGARLQARPPRPVPHLTPVETELYQALVSEAWTRVRRIEQERIPLPAAIERLKLLTRGLPAGPPSPAPDRVMIEE